MKEPQDMKQVASMGAAILSIMVLIGAIFGVWGLIVPAALYFMSVSNQ